MLVDQHGRKLIMPSEERKLSQLNTKLHPLDDPEEWKKSVNIPAPPGVDVKECQRQVNNIYGLTKNGQEILKVVWSGDREFWFEFFMNWNILGQPTKDATKRPRIRFKALRDENGVFERDVFPSRWLILHRIEPEQIAHDWEERSYYFDPSTGTRKQLRPDTVPNPFWLNHMTVMRHTDYCCTTRHKQKQLCFGFYADPQYALADLLTEKQNVQASGEKFTPFEKIDGETVDLFNSEQNGYKHEVEQLQIESQIYLENPFALLGVAEALRLDINTRAKAQDHVREYFKAKIDAVAEQGKI